MKGKLNLHTLTGVVQIGIAAVAAAGGAGLIQLDPQWLAILLTIQNIMGGAKNTASGMNGRSVT